uniref:Protein FATTY ACID EXPORT 4ic n=1 Tax=Rhizophora mucronata TaxID=61149 RepID=A0A2P2K1D4_RHIMU
MRMGVLFLQLFTLLLPFHILLFPLSFYFLLILPSLSLFSQLFFIFEFFSLLPSKYLSL